MKNRFIKLFMTIGLVLALLLVGCGGEKLDGKVVDSDTQTQSETESETETAIPETDESEEYIDAASVDGETSLEDEDYDKYEEKQVKSGTGSDLVTYSDGSQQEQDQYKTDPIPEGQPNPVEPEDVTVVTSKSGTCTLYIECSTILNNMGDLTEGKDVLVPDDGVIYATRTVTFYEGESVFDVLLREVQNNRIHMEYSFTPMYNSNYIEGINNLYEKDCGSLSGWMYCVNGWYPNYGCSRYIVKQGDVIEWHYTCDLGRDLGQYWVE